MIKRIIKFRNMFFAVSGVILVSLLSCASIPLQSDKVAAYVDHDPITIGDIEYSLQITHRKEGLPKTEGINISDYLNKIIDERLLVHEARRMGMDRNAELIQQVDSYILSESVERLYSEEILDKVTVSEKEILDHFKKEYEQYTLSFIETGTAEDSGLILKQLKAGTDFNMLAREFAGHESRKGAEEATFVRKDLNNVIKDVIDSLEPGEVSGMFEAGHRFYLIKLINRRNAPEEKLMAKREDIKQTITKNKVRQRSDEYLAYLRKKMKPEIDNELLSSILPDGNRDELYPLMHDKRAVVKLRDSILTVGDFVSMLISEKSRPKDVLIKQWIDQKVVDHEALDRKYYVNTDLKDKILRYKNKMLIKIFVKNVLSPGVVISEDELIEFYRNNQDDFSRPERYKVQQITAMAKSDAEEIKNELLKGADFSWMAKHRSLDNFASAGGMTGWKVKDQLPEELKDVVGGLEPGEISDVMISGNFFRIYRLQEKTGKQVEEFERVRPAVHKKILSVKYKELYDSYVAKLKEEADIELNDEVVQDLDRMINNGKYS